MTQIFVISPGQLEEGNVGMRPTSCLGLQEGGGGCIQKLHLHHTWITADRDITGLARHSQSSLVQLLQFSIEEGGIRQSLEPSGVVLNWLTEKLVRRLWDLNRRPSDYGQGVLTRQAVLCRLAVKLVHTAGRIQSFLYYHFRMSYSQPPWLNHFLTPVYLPPDKPVEPFFLGGGS